MRPSTRTVRQTHDELRMFGLRYPLLAAYPEVTAVCAMLPDGHQWRHRRDVLLDDLGVSVSDDDLVCIQRIDPTCAWVTDNVVVVDVPEELRRYHHVEREAWLESHLRTGRRT